MGAVNSITNSISNAIGTSGSGNGLLEDPAKALTNLGKEVSKSPIAQAAITAGGAALGVPPAVTAGLLGANQTSQTGGNLVNGLTTGGLSYLGGTGLNNYLQSGSVLGSTGTAAASAAEKAAARDLIAKGYSESAAWELVNSGAAGVDSTVGAGASGGLLGSLGTALGGVSNSTLGQGLGALAGAALGSQDATQTSGTSGTSEKSPWGPAQQWIKENINNGRTYQTHYQQNPFSAYQLSAYGNSKNLSDGFRGNMNSLLQQMNSQTGYSRQNPSAKPTAFQFASMPSAQVDFSGAFPVKS